MPDSRYRWVIVAAGGLMGCVAVGAMFTLPVFLRAIARDTGWSMTGISAAMTLGFIAMAFASMAWGSLSDRIGTRAVVMAGAVLLPASIALASRAPSLPAFQLVFGLAVGGAAAAVFAPMMACVTGWFDTHRSLAVSLVSAGMGMAPMTMSPLAAWLASTHDWRTSMLAIAALAAVVMVPASLLVRQAPALDGAQAPPGPAGAPAAMSIGPCSFSTSRTSRWISLSRDTSHATTPAPSRRSAPITAFGDSLANRSTSAFPIPLAAPVTTITLFSSSIPGAYAIVEPNLDSHHCNGHNGYGHDWFGSG